MVNLKNKRKRVSVPRPPTIGSLVDKSVHVDEIDEDFEVGEAKIQRRIYKREYARQWQRNSRARIVEIHAQELARNIETHKSRLETTSQHTLYIP